MTHGGDSEKGGWKRERKEEGVKRRGRNKMRRKEELKLLVKKGVSSLLRFLKIQTIKGIIDFQKVFIQHGFIHIVLREDNSCDDIIQNFPIVCVEAGEGNTAARDEELRIAKERRELEGRESMVERGRKEGEEMGLGWREGEEAESSVRETVSCLPWKKSST